MSMLVFMPWCQIDNAYNVGDAIILPFERHRPIDDLDDAAHCNINTLLATYKDIEGNPVHKAAILRYRNYSPIYDLTDDDQTRIDVFEKFADTSDFLRPPPDQKNSLDSHWKRMLYECSSKIALKKAFNQVWNRLPSEQARCSEGNQNKGK